MAAMGVFISFLFLCMAWLGCARTQPSGANFSIVVESAQIQDANADTQRLRDAWNAACATPGYVTLSIPRGTTITLNPFAVNGPCKSTNIHIKVLGNIMASTDMAAWRGFDQIHWIIINNVNGLTIDGSGQINGQGPFWWDCKAKGRCSPPASTLGLLNCKNTVLKGVNFVNSPGKHVILHGCNRVHISQVSITAPEDSPNTDGIYVETSQHVEILDSKIGTGDDCIAIGSGVSDLNISRIICGPGHGISIGSLGRSGSYAAVEQIHISNSQFIQTMNGARIKTWQGGSGFARAITFEQLKFTDVDQAIVIDQYYCDGGHGCSNKTNAVQVSNIQFIGLNGTANHNVPISLACSETVGCTGILFDSVQLASTTPGKQITSYCLNAHGTAIPPVFPSVLCLS